MKADRAFRQGVKDALAVLKDKRQRRAKSGWWIWYHNRGRIGLTCDAKELRMVSHRRVL